jgi:hypothetical protein
MDGFPNGRRLEDDVTRIELQAVAGVALAAIGLWYDDYVPGQTPSPVTQDLLDVLTYDTGVSANDTTFQAAFPYVQMPWSGTSRCTGEQNDYVQPAVLGPTTGVTGLSAPVLFAENFPNPFRQSTTIKYRLRDQGKVLVQVFDATGKLVEVLRNQQQTDGVYQVNWNAGNRPPGIYYATISVEGQRGQTLKMNKVE